VNPWRAAEEKFNIFNEVFKFKVDINDFKGYVDISLKESSHKIPEMSKNCVLRKWNVHIVTKKLANLQIQRTTDFMTISLLGQPLELRDPVPYVKSWLRSHYSAV
jgi:hypothetical protein